MRTIKELSRNDLEQGLRDKDVKTLQVLFIGMAAGLIVFTLFIMGLVVFGNIQLSSLPERDMATAKILFLVFIAIAFIEYSVGSFVTRMFTRPGNIHSAMNRSWVGTNTAVSTDPVQVVLSFYRRIMIVRLAIFEGVALFGNLLFFILWGMAVLPDQKLYALTLVPSVIMLGFVFLFFPTKEKVVFYIENNILVPLRGVQE